MWWRAWKWWKEGDTHWTLERGEKGVRGRKWVGSCLSCILSLVKKEILPTSCPGRIESGEAVAMLGMLGGEGMQEEER